MFYYSMPANETKYTEDAEIVYNGGIAADEDPADYIRFNPKGVRVA